MKNLIAVCLAGATSAVVSACPYDPKDPLLELRAAADATVVRITVQGPGCNNIGTGFFFTAKGHVLTAGHVVPESCVNDRTAIDVWWSKSGDTKSAGPFKAQVIGRSSLDVAVLALEAKPDASRQYLKARPGNEDAASLKNSCILLASHYLDQTDTYSTFAEVASVSLEGDHRWALSGEGFNATRSGSPVILRSGQAAAIFVARPSDPADRNNIIFSRAYVLPLSLIPKSEIDLAALAASDGDLKAFPIVVASKARSVNTSFGLSITEGGGRVLSDSPAFFITREGELKPAPSNPAQIAIEAIGSRHSVVRQINVDREFKADPGFVFDPSTIRYDIASINPSKSTLPTSLCTAGNKENCVELSKDGKTLKLNLWMYPGIDGRRAWIDAEMHVVQKPE